MPNNQTYYFNEPRLQMTIGGRFLVRLVSYFSYGVLVAVMAVCWWSDLAQLRAIGWLIALFLVDRLYHIGKPERPIARLTLSHGNARCYMAPATERVLELALERAGAMGGDVVLHLANELIKVAEIRKGLVRMDVSADAMTTKVNDYLHDPAQIKIAKKDLLVVLEAIVLSALNIARASYASAIEPKDLFAAIGESGNEQIRRLFKLFDINTGDLAAALLFSKKAPFTLAGFFSRPFRARHRVMNRAWTARPTPFLDQYATDLTDLARAGVSGFMVGHQDEYERLVNVLARPGQPNALLIGEPGSGRETLINHLAFAISKDRVPKPLFDKRLVALEIGSLVAGAKEGEVQDRVKRLVAEIIAAGNIVLYIPNIHNLLKTSGEMRLSAADILLPEIRNASFSVLGATSPREFKQFIEPNSDFAGIFEAIRVQEISEGEAVQYLVYQSLIMERPYKVTISFGAVKESVRLAHKYFRQQLLPGSAEGLLKESLSAAVADDKKVLSADEIIATAEKKVNIPIHKAAGAEVAELLNLEEIIHKKFVDQEEAVQAVSRSLREYRSGLARQGGPIAAFLFVGPTGVGKTELSKMLSEVQFGSRDFMVRFDMSEYQDKQSFFRFIGSPDGTTRGALTDAVLEKPYCLVLLDEFEKAHPDILNLFLQVFDDGRLTDNLGRTVDFTNTIIIATSNANSTLIKEEIEKGTAIKEIAELLKKRLTEYFKPELINRFSDIIVFKSLSPDDTKVIARLNLLELAAALREAQGIDLSFDDATVSAIAKLGYDPVFGARPLRAVISDRLKSVLADKILKGEVQKGGAIKVSYQDEAFTFTASGS